MVEYVFVNELISSLHLSLSLSLSLVEYSSIWSDYTIPNVSKRKRERGGGKGGRAFYFPIIIAPMPLQGRYGLRM